MSKSLHALRYQRLPAMLREMLEQAGLTQWELAARLRLAPSLVHKTEVGERRADIAEFLDWCIACEFDPEVAFRRLIEERGAHRPSKQTRGQTARIIGVNSSRSH